MSKLIKLGYQGIIGSNSHKAALTIIKKLEGTNIVLVPLFTSKGVVDNLIGEEIQYGIMALHNNTAGEVLETKIALQNKKILKLVEIFDMPIHHCLFVKSCEVSMSSILVIASHMQALKQCEKTLIHKFNRIRFQEEADTALSAIKLSVNIFPKTTAILCSREAGDKNKLHLLLKNVEDNKNNQTTFGLFKIN